jgi:hypothetical protein
VVLWLGLLLGLGLVVLVGVLGGVVVLLGLLGGWVVLVLVVLFVILRESDLLGVVEK